MFYGTRAGFIAYHVARGRVDVEDMEDEAIDAALLIASEWLDNRYRGKFPGTKVGEREQVREWPRHSAFDIYGYVIASDATPAEVASATYEAAYKELITPGALSKDWTPAKYESVSVSGAVSVKYAQFNTAADLQTRFAIVDEVLLPVLTGVADTSGLSGVAVRR